MKVLAGFECALTGAFCDKGSDYQHEDDNRLIELANLGLIEFDPKDVIEVFPDDEVEQEQPDYTVAGADLALQELTVKELKAMLDQKGIKYTDKALKGDLIELLSKAD